MAELIKTWGDGSSLLVNYTGRGDGTITVSGDANSGEARSMELSVRAGSLVRTLTVNQAAAQAAVELYDYIVQDGSTYFATDIKIARDVLILGVCRTYGKSLILWSADVLQAKGDAYFNIANVKYSSGSTYQQVQCNAPVTSSALPGYAYVQLSLTNIAVACQGMQSSWTRLMKYKNITSDSDAIADYEPSELRYAKDGKNYSGSVGKGPANLYVMGNPLLDGSVNTAGYANSGIPTSEGARLYYVKVYEADGTKSHHLRPAVKDSTIGLYDTVTDVFYAPNAGSPTVGNI